MSAKDRPKDQVPISRDQAIAFRLGRQHLTERASPTRLPTVVGEMGGAQAQLLAAAQMSLAARVRDLRESVVESSIWGDRTLAKAWCMRRTLFLLPARDLSIFVRGSARRAEKEVTWMRRHRLPEKALEELIAATLSALDQPRTQSELTVLVAKTLGARLSTGQWGGWGSSRHVPCVELESGSVPATYLMHLAGARGVICSGPSREGQATYVRADVWLPRWKDIPQDRAERELLRLYLRAFGPATPKDFVAWTRMLFSDARKIWVQEEENLVPVDVEGWPAWILRQDLPELERAELPGSSVRLLPYFDSFLLGHAGRDHVVEKKRLKDVYRPQGWIAPVLLVNGRAVGVWSHMHKGAHLSIEVRPFSRLSADVSRQIREEARGLGGYLECATVNTQIL
jgi:uncharacterized protein YcaQ